MFSSCKRGGNWRQRFKYNYEPSIILLIIIWYNAKLLLTFIFTKKNQFHLWSRKDSEILSGLTQGYTTNKWSSQDLNSGVASSKIWVFFPCIMAIKHRNSIFAFLNRKSIQLLPQNYEQKSVSLSRWQPALLHSSVPLQETAFSGMESMVWMLAVKVTYFHIQK